MENIKKVEIYNNPAYESYVVEYRGDLLGELSRIDYAVGFKITDKLGIIAVKEEDFERIYNDVPSILLQEFRQIYVLQEELQVSDTSNINYIKENKYLDLDGSGVLVGLVDTGIDYLNQEFIYEDNTTRIHSIWDQNILKEDNPKVYIGDIFTREQINQAIIENKNGKDPYAVVPVKDEVGHGTKMAGIIGGRGYNKELQGVAKNCEFIVVKLLQSESHKNKLNKNGIVGVPVYNNAEILAAIEYLDRVRRDLEKPMVILLALGTTTHSHDGSGILSRFIDEILSYNPIAVVTGMGNEGDSEGHVTGYIYNTGDKRNVELKIPRIVSELNLMTWIRKPDAMSINIISPSGEQSRVIRPKVLPIESIARTVNYVYEDTILKVSFFVPEVITGHQAIVLDFYNIKPGIWKFELAGEYIVQGRFDMWLPPKLTLPEGLKFLNPNPESTHTIPSSSKDAISVGYYDSSNNSIVSASGKGYNINDYIKPNIVAPGVNIVTTKVGGGKTVVSGSGAAAAIVAGVCALNFQWGIVDGKDKSMNSKKLKSYLINGANRNDNYTYPNKNWGYGRLDLMEIFNKISGIGNRSYEGYKEYTVGKLFVRVPKKFG